ncbi:hypothetical protein MBLNU230_g1687t1 [Neophaeotheca triangularis]
MLSTTIFVTLITLATATTTTTPTTRVKSTITPPPLDPNEPVPTEEFMGPQPWAWINAENTMKKREEPTAVAEAKGALED